jgi:hypothetical protein
MLFIETPGLEKLLLSAPEVIGAARVKADRVAEEAKVIAPVRTGAYRDSIHVEQDGIESNVVADVPYAGFVEFGTEDTPIFAPLRRALSAESD